MKHMNFTAPMHLAAPRQGALPSRFEGVAYSGAVIESMGVVIDLASTQVADRLPLLSEHNLDRTIGVIERTTKEGGRLVVSGRLFTDMPGGHAERLAEFAKRGIEFQMSVGLFNYVEEFVPKGQAITVNSSAVVGPVTVLRQGRVRECSFVTLGADANTSARLFTGGKVQPMLSVREIYRRRRVQGDDPY
jgi:hypothetical protein